MDASEEDEVRALELRVSQFLSRLTERSEVLSDHWIAGCPDAAARYASWKAAENSRLSDRSAALLAAQRRDEEKQRRNRDCEQLVLSLVAAAVEHAELNRHMLEVARSEQVEAVLEEEARQRVARRAALAAEKFLDEQRWREVYQFSSDPQVSQLRREALDRIERSDAVRAALQEDEVVQLESRLAKLSQR